MRSSPRIVSLVPSVTETLLAWGIEPVACTRFCEQPQLHHVGGTKDPDVGAIADLGPDLVVVVDEEENRREDHDALVDAGVTVHVLAVRDLAHLDEQLAGLADAVDARWEPVGTVVEPPPTRSAWVPTEAIRESPDSYSTPAIVETADGPELIVTGGDVVTGHDLGTGAELWRLEGLNPRNARDYRIVASPIVEGEIIVAPTRVRPLTVMRAGGRGDVTDSHRLWTTDFGPDVPTPVTDGTYLYVVRDNGVVHCFDLRTGEEIYGQERLANGSYSASLVLADGLIYATSEDGITTVYRSGAEFEIVAENDLEGYTLSSPAIADGQIFMRTDFALWAIGESRGE